LSAINRGITSFLCDPSMAKKSKRPTLSNLWGRYSKALTESSLSNGDLTRQVELWMSILTKGRTLTDNDLSQLRKRATRHVLKTEAEKKADALFQHFEINANSSERWKELALSLAVHSVPGFLPTGQGPRRKRNLNPLGFWLVWTAFTRRLLDEARKPNAGLPPAMTSPKSLPTEEVNTSEILSDTRKKIQANPFRLTEAEFNATLRASLDEVGDSLPQFKNMRPKTFRNRFQEYLRKESESGVAEADPFELIEIVQRKR
jgi:hypothetical protein